MNHRNLTLPLAALAASLALLAGCNRNEDRSAAPPVDGTTQNTERPAESGTERAIERAANATERAGERMARAGDAVADKAGDAAITASVNAELAKDPALSALRIDVDTANGRVVLKGSAPDAAARERATQLAQGVRGVVGVDNQLRVGG